MKKTLTAVICIMLVALMGIATPLVMLFSAKQPDPSVDDNGLDAVYADEEENDLSGLTADALHTVDADLADNGYARVSSLAYSYSGYKSYTASDISLFKTVPNKTIGGLTCTAMQGMNVGTTYIYTVKIHKDEQRASIMRTNANTGEQVEMSYYSSLSATSASNCTTLGHANDLTVVTVTENGSSVNYMYVATCTSGKTVARLKISGTKLYFTGYFKTVNSSGTAFTVSSIRGIRRTGGYLYFLVKSGMNFYTFRVAEGANGGSASSPTSVTCYKAFTIDTRNAVYALSSSSYGTLDNVETWINQGFGYNSDTSSIYVPLYKSNIDGSSSNDNVILVYDVSGLLTTTLLNSNTNYSRLLFPCTLTFRIKDTSSTMFEVESCGFRTSQGTTGDLKMYFNTNSNSASKEGIYKINYNRGSTALVPIADENSIVYTVKYDANGGEAGTSDSHFKMNSTRHIKGISTRLRPNTFVKSGNTFIGWYLKRSSDGKWLYFDTDGTARWYIKGSQPVGSRLALYEDKRKVSQLTSVNGDTITCYAQWKPNSTGTTSYYIRYDANGGTGSMSDTKVVYGTSTAIRTNTFTRSGYQFSGWIAHRMSDNSWIYKDSSSLSDKWITVGDSTSGYFLKAYPDGCSVSKTSSTDRDIVTFYAAWTRITGENYPTTLEAGTDFTFKGTVESDAGLYEVKLVITDSSGNVKVSKAVNPKTNTYNVANLNSSITTANLSAGSYIYRVYATTMSGANSKTTVTVLSKTFTVT
ncbi:MAG: InlB B-repeat-containing protein [Eubacteriales bacterium]|nr:InlB B-repeat-containing protein [Eubacteriales bacterium]